MSDRGELGEDGLPKGVVSGESELPLEHTARVRAAESRNKTAPSSLKVHDGQTSSQMAAASRRRLRKERDRRAERRAIQVLLAVAVAAGVVGFLAINFLVDDSSSADPEKGGPSLAVAKKKQVRKTKPARPGVRSSPIDETPDLPALRSMQREGLTAGAEGLPEVLADGTHPQLATLAGLETCRFAYGVWEFSPNKRFRFFSTCKALGGQVLVGAYQLDGAVIRMSPLTAGHARIRSEFHVEKPSRFVSRVELMHQGKVMTTLTVNQRVTAIRPGLDGEAFRNSYRGKNNLQVGGNIPAGGAAAPPPKPKPAKEKDPLLKLLEEG